MFDYKRKQKVQRALYSKGIMVALIVVLVVLAKASWSGYLKNKASGESLGETQRQLADLRQRKQYLEGEVARLSTERGLEEEIRGKFQVAREGENVLIVVDPVAPTTTPKTKTGFWSWIKSFFTR